MTESAAILFTAFEPSGDALAARLVRELKRREPARPIYALGGAQMRAAGAELIESTTDRAVMGAGAAGQALAHHRRVGRLGHWLARHPIAALVPVDSPAGNWAICGLVRRRRPGARIVHLVGPQLWAWAPWRARKLRRLTDQVMCLLPFEPGWFDRRGIPASFVGHPLFDPDAPARAGIEGEGIDLPGSPRLAILPGSRAAEIRRNWPLMRGAVDRLRARYPDAASVVALRQEPDRALLGEAGPGFEVRVGQTDAALAWAEAALVVSGTATLQVAAHATPMVAVYKASPLAWHLAGRWLVRTRTFTLPNLIGEMVGRGGGVRGRIIPELVPYFGKAPGLAAALSPLMEPGEAREAQVEGLEAIGRCYRGVRFAAAAADVLGAQLEAAAPK